MADSEKIRIALDAWRLAVMRMPELPARAKVVAVVLGSYLNIENADISSRVLSGNIFPGIDSIAKGAGTSRRTAAAGIAELGRSGCISWRRRSHNSNFYSLHLFYDVQNPAHHEVQAAAHSDVKTLARREADDVQGFAQRAKDNVQVPVALCADMRAVTCEPLHRNPCNNPINPLTNILDDLRNYVGNRDFNAQPFEGAEFIAPNIISLASLKHTEIALRRYRPFFEKRQLVVKQRANSGSGK